MASVAIVLSACSAEPAAQPEATGATSAAVTVGGCDCPTSGACSDVSYPDIPSDNGYYITTFGGGSDTQSMACGGTADGTWAYVADEARFGCGAKLLIEAGGKSCVAQVADCGPNRCVEQAAANSGCTTNHPIIDASPFITQYLLGVGSAGWSDDLAVTATLVDPSTPIGCPAPVSVLDAATPPSDAGDEPPEPDGSPAPGPDAAANNPPPPPAGDAQAPAPPPAASSSPGADASTGSRSGCAVGGPRGDTGFFLGLALALLAVRRRRPECE